MVVLGQKIGLGAFDLDTISAPITLRTSGESEKITLLGEDKVTTLEEGQLVYSDEVGVTTMSFNYRDADRTKVTTKTKNIILFADGCKGISDQEVSEALDSAVSLITKFCGGKITQKDLVK